MDAITWWHKNVGVQQQKMPMRYLWIILFVTAASCNSTTTGDAGANKVNDSITQTTPDVKRQDTVCYLAVQNRDSILLQLHITDSTVTGLMQYDNFGMDGNNGTLQAELRNKRIEGHFRFFAEGTWSVREIVFEQQGEQWLQAQTDNMLYSGDTVRFENKNNLKFDAQRVFKSVDCGQLHFGVMPN